MAKLQSIVDIENIHKNKVLVLKPPSSSTNILKYFSTFPYPYMNGRLHLGHAYTMMDPELKTRYKKARGYNVLFPFGFHGSGMPIYASTMKLKHELETTKLYDTPVDLIDDYVKQLPKSSQIKILYEMQVPIEKIKDFSNPHIWVPYFSELAKTDLNDFHIFADFSRSFYTTITNPYYDSFIKWQFKYLLERGYVYKGTRNMIYSVRDSQPCADHDRQIGEGVKPFSVLTMKMLCNDINILVTVCSKDNIKVDEIGKTYTIVFTFGEKFVFFSINGTTFISNEKSYLNILGQQDVTDFRYVNSEEFTKLCVDMTIVKSNKKFKCKNIIRNIIRTRI